MLTRRGVLWVTWVQCVGGEYVQKSANVIQLQNHVQRGICHIFFIPLFFPSPRHEGPQR